MHEMPTDGRDWAELKREMIERGTGDAKWREGKTAVYVFNAGEDVAAVQKEAYTLYMSENGLGPLAFPSLKQMEDEVIGMGLSLLHAPEDGAGTITSGGTDSITMAVKAARDHARATRGVSAAANLVAPFSAHPAFDKAAHLMDIEVRKVPVGDNLLADVAAMADAIDEQTVMLVGSAPNFPYGLIDPIEALGRVAEARSLWLHVDACVGGYFAPFARMNGLPVAPFDFSVPGVRSISADLHKYGYTAKGASTLFHRSAAQREHQVFQFDAWPAGGMTTPTAAGTRPGGAIASAWAVLHYLGVEGYREKARLVTDTRAHLMTEIAAHPALRTFGDPQLGLFTYGSDELDIFAVWGRMAKRGWFTGLVTEPRGIHLMLSPVHAQVADEYLRDLRESVDDVAATGEDAAGVSARYS